MFVEHNTSRAQITDCQSPTHKITRLSLGNVIARACKTLLSYMEAQSWCLASHLALNLWGELRHLHPTHVTDVPWLFTSVPPRCLDVPREVLGFQSLRATSHPREQKCNLEGTCPRNSPFSESLQPRSYKTAEISRRRWQADLRSIHREKKPGKRPTTFTAGPEDVPKKVVDSKPGKSTMTMSS